MSIDLTITARTDATGPGDGMRLGELEQTCRTLRDLGADDETPLTVVPNRAHRLRTLSANVPGHGQQTLTDG
jgi:hypothetical protein